METFTQFFEESAFFGILLTCITYCIGMQLKKKFKFAIFNPLLISIILSIIVVVVFKIDIKKYNESNKLFTSLLTPATVCLAIPLYEQFEKLKNNWKAILGGIFAGVLTSLSIVLLLCIILKLNHETYVSLLPKSITTAIGLVVSDQLGGIVPITVAVIIVTGIFGNVFAELILKIFHISDPVAKGIAIGTASHALGTAKAIEMGEVEGAMSSLSIAVTGLLTVIGSSIFAQFL